MLHSSLRNIRHFNSRPHKKVDRNRKSGSSVGIIFQLTISRGCRLSKRILCVHNCIFQLTTSRGDRLEPTSLPLAMCDHFNSRPHEEIDKDLRVALWHLVISTHDLTRRSTSGCRCRHTPTDISTHDLTRRSTYNPIRTA